MSTTDNRFRIGQQLADLRNERGLTTRELAEITGLNYSNINKIERGAYNASLDIINKICDALGAQIIVSDTQQAAK